MSLHTEIYQKNAFAVCGVFVKQYYIGIGEAEGHRIELLVSEPAKRNGVTEQLKAENQMEWVGKMNACKALIRSDSEV